MSLLKFHTFIFILKIYDIIIAGQVCNYYSDCTCSYCGEGSTNYANCDFINLFCEEGNNIFTSKFSNYKSRYINAFKKERDAETFCGEQKPAIKEDQKETLIIKTGSSYTKGSRIHCHYNVIYNDYYNSYSGYNPLMTYEVSGGGNNKIKFNLIVIYHSSTYDKTDIFTDDELRNTPYYDSVKDYDSVELFVDFKSNSYSHIDEVFTVKVKLKLKEGGSEDKKGLSSGGIAGLASSIIGFAIVAGIFYWCCCCPSKKKD